MNTALRIVLTSFIALAATLATAQPQSEPMKVEPKTLIITVVKASGEALCPTKEQVIKVKLITGKGTQEFVIKPPRRGDKTENDATTLPPFSVRMDNRKGQLGLTTGARIEISTWDKRTWTPQDYLRFPPGTLHDTLVVTCRLKDDGFWEFTYWAD